MKLSKPCIIVWMIVFLLAGCVEDDFVICSLPEYIQKELYTEGAWQDFTDYGIYTFSAFDEAKLEENLYFEKVTDVESILSYIDNFEDWVAQCQDGAELAENYHFDKTWIDETDYIFIDTEEGKQIGNCDRTYGKFDNYDIYFFDTDAWTLYYFHSNI